MKNLFFTAILIITTGTTLAARPHPQAKKFGNSYYYVFTDGANFVTALNRCASMGGSLAVIDNDQEYRHILGLMKGNSAWIGVARINKQGPWAWISGKQLDRGFPWDSGQPSGSDAELSAALHPHGKIHDHHWWDHLHYVCEWPIEKAGQDDRKKKMERPAKKQPNRQNKTKVRIPRDAVKYKGHYYMVVESPATPGVAMQQCKKVGGHLARIQSEAEQQFLWRLIQNGRWDHYYVDGTDEASEGRWLFSNGKPMRYFAWSHSEPNNINSEEHWVILVKSNNGGRWFDGNGSGRRPYICEWDTANRGARVEDVVEEREEPELEEPEEEPEPFSFDDEPQEEPLEPFSLDDDPTQEEATGSPPTDPEGILGRAGLYEGRPSVWYLKRANNFAARTYEQLSKSSEIRGALRAVNGRLPTKAEMNNPPSRR